MVKTKDIKIFFLYFMCACFVFLKIYRNSIDYASGAQGGIWNIIIALLTCWGILAILLDSHKKNSVIIVSVVYAVVVWINGILSLSSIDMAFLYYLIVAPSFAAVLWLSYKLNRSGVSQGNKSFWMLCWGIILVFLLYTYIDYFSQYQYWQSSERIALNNSYYAACVIPFFLRAKEKWHKYFIFLSVVVVFISNKRAGLLAVLAGFVVFYFVNAVLSNSYQKALKRILIGATVIVALGVVFLIIDNKFSLNVFNRMAQLFEDGGSGRILIYEYVWKEISNSSVEQIILGHGVSSITTLEMGLSSAHCDFLNVAYEYGIVSAVLLVVFYVAIARQLLKMTKNKYYASGAFAFSIVVSFAFSLFSANLDNQSFSLILALYWGWELVEYEKYEKSSSDRS